MNKLGQTLKITAQDGRDPQTNVYDRRGSLVQTIDEFNNTTSYRYNERNQVVEIAYGDKLSNPGDLKLYGNESEMVIVTKILPLVTIANQLLLTWELS